MIAHPAVRGTLCRALQRGTHPRFRAPLHRRGGGRRRVLRRADARTTTSSRRTATTGTRSVRGVPATAIMAEMYGMQEGCSRGRGGSMHLFDVAHRFYGGNAIVGGGLPVAVGLGLARKMQGRGGVVACFFGEGAVAEGEFHECMNLAALWELPVLFCCENNLYAMGTALGRSESETDLVAEGGELRDAGVAGRRDGCRRRARRDAPRGRSRSARAAARTSSSCAPIGSAPTRCTTPSATATRRRSSTGRSATRSRRSSGDTRSRRATSTRSSARSREEVDAAVAFAEAGTPEPVEDLTRFVTSEAGRT